MAGAAHPIPGRRDAGFTFVEVITALMISAIATVACFQAFAYGAVQLERLGYRRQALGLLDGEMEYWRSRFQSADAEHPVDPAEAEDRNREVEPDPGAHLAFRVETEIGAARNENRFRVQRVEVRVTYEKADLADTLELKENLYVR